MTFTTVVITTIMIGMRYRYAISTVALELELEYIILGFSQFFDRYGNFFYIGSTGTHTVSMGSSRSERRRSRVERRCVGTSIPIQYLLLPRRRIRVRSQMTRTEGWSDLTLSS